MTALFEIFGVICVVWGVVLATNLFDAAERAAAGYRERAAGAGMQTARGQRIAGMAVAAVGVFVIVTAPFAG